MTTPADTPPAEHAATIRADAPAVHAECSCGWVGGSEQTRHLALADFAAHVHAVNDQAAGPRWRLVVTDSESDSGVAPVCPSPDVHAMMHGGRPDDREVYNECCVGPHIECFSPRNAAKVLAALNEAEAELCS